MDHDTQAAGATRRDHGAPVDVHITTTTAEKQPQEPSAEKLVVAVHGIGEQYSYATIQSVVNQFCAFYNQPAGVPLGSFHNSGGPFRFRPPYPEDLFCRYAFAEVYWAKIPRGVLDEKYTLEESKKWANTLVERLKMRWNAEGRNAQCQDNDFPLLKQVLAEMIQTVAVLDRVCWLADRAGLFTFDLRKLLDQYLGDVQVVAEFADPREKILAAFHEVLEQSHRAHPEAEIYIIAHSEGTVVSLLGLLRAFQAEHPPAWTSRVRGLMTLGSPIDKHLMLWPELFGTGADARPRHAPPAPIEWRNYYDRGDPVGYELESVRDWLREHGWQRVFNFTDEHDFGFTRYPLPGKAHVDYWSDQAVFGHFLTSVLGQRPPEGARLTEDVTRPPQDRRLSKWLGYVLPYVGVASLLCIAVYILFKAVTGAITPDSEEPPGAVDILTFVLRSGLVLFGVTVAARVPRLTKSRTLRGVAIGTAMLACAIYFLTAGGGTQVDPLLGLTVPQGLPTVVLAAVVTLLAYVGSALRPAWGVTPLMIAGTLIIVGKVGYHLAAARQASEIGPLWPVFLATAAFLYLWWLAALILDLVVAWHWYIRQSRVGAMMDEIVGGKRKRRREPGTGPAVLAPQA